MRRVIILKANHYSHDGKVLWLKEGQEVVFADSYAAALVSMQQARWVGPAVPEETPIVVPVNPPAEEKPVKTRAKK